TYGDLGVNFRAIASRIIGGYLQPHAEAITARYEALRAEAEALLTREIDALFAPEPEAERARGGLLSWLGLAPSEPRP
ncbi:hypothetical protein, partial [Escherichia coli]